MLTNQILIKLIKENIGGNNSEQNVEYSFSFIKLNQKDHDFEFFKILG